MNEKNRNLVLRIVSAAVLLPVVLVLLVRGGYWTAGLLAWAAATCAGEYFAITHRKLSPPAWVGIALAAALPVLPVLRPGNAATLAFWAVVVFFYASWIWYLLRGPLGEAPQLAAHLVTGLVYGGAALMAISALRTGPQGLEWVICALVITWANDTCAYFAGRFLGRHKLYPAVSPNKTWEGFAGGMVGSIGGLFVFKAVFFSGLGAIDCVVLGALGGTLGPLGDLAESMLKRAYQVKDSGKIIPGHGGLLDRIDALLFNGPAVFLYVHYLRDLLPR